MALPETFFNELQDYLRVDLFVSSFTNAASNTPEQRSQINVGEEFSVHVTVTNTAPRPSVNGVYIFNNIVVSLTMTSFAVPLNSLAANAQTIPFTETPLVPGTLRPGQSASVNFHMKATRNIGGIADWFATEEIARINLKSDFDFNAYFKIFSSTRIFNHEIEP